MSTNRLFFSKFEVSFGQVKAKTWFGSINHITSAFQQLGERNIFSVKKVFLASSLFWYILQGAHTTFYVTKPLLVKNLKYKKT